MTAQPPLPPQASPPGGPAVAAFFDRIRRYGAVRPDEGRWFAGVAAALARRWGVDPLLVRGGFVLLTVFGGIGLLLYGLGWLFLPQPDGRIHAQEVLRGVVTAGFIGGLLCVLLDLGGSSWSRGGWFVGPHPFAGGLLFLVLVGLAVWWFAGGRHRGWRSGPGWNGPGGPRWGGPGGQEGHGGPGWGGTGWSGPGTPGQPGASEPTGTAGGRPGTTPPTPGAHDPYGSTPTGSGTDAGTRSPRDPDAGRDPADIPPYGTPPPPRAYSPGGYPTPTAGYPTDSNYLAGGAGAPTFTVAPPAAARWAPKPDFQRPSHALTNVTLGAALLGAAVVVLANVLWGFSAPGGFVAAGVALGIVALGVLAAGISGRRAGGLALTGIVLAVATLAGGSAAGRMTWAGEAPWVPGVVQGTTSYDLGIGEARLDLRQVSAPGATAASPAEINARVGLGKLTVLVPHGVPVRIIGTTGAGAIDNAGHLNPTSSASPAPVSSSGRGPSEQVDLETATNPVIVIRANVGAGNLTIDRANV